MWKYVKRYLSYAVLAAAFMVGEVLMELLQPELMSRIADDGVLGVHTGGVGDMSLIWALGLKMTCLVLFGGLCGSLNTAFVYPYLYESHHQYPDICGGGPDSACGCL